MKTVITEGQNLADYDMPTEFPALMQYEDAKRLILLITNFNKEDETFEGMLICNSEDYNFGELSAGWEAHGLRLFHGSITLSN